MAHAVDTQKPHMTNLVDTEAQTSTQRIWTPPFRTATMVTQNENETIRDNIVYIGIVGGNVDNDEIPAYETLAENLAVGANNLIDLEK